MTARAVLGLACAGVLAAGACRTRPSPDATTTGATPQSPGAAPAAAAPASAPQAAAPQDAAPAGKRVGPPRVEPVMVGGVRIEALPWGKRRGLGQNGGYIAAYDATTGKELWTLKVYDVVYTPPMEEDVQDVFITSIVATPSGGLQITDERGRRYAVELKTRTVRPL